MKDKSTVKIPKFSRDLNPRHSEHQLDRLLDDIKVCQDCSFKTKFTPGADTAHLTCVLSYLCVLVWKMRVCAHSSSLYLWRSMFVNDGGRVRVRGGSWRDANRLSHSICC